MDFTELMDEVERLAGHSLPDEAHKLIGDYVREKVVVPKLSNEQLQAERDRLAAQVSALEERIERMTEHGVGAAALASAEVQ